MKIIVRQDSIELEAEGSVDASKLYTAEFQMRDMLIKIPFSVRGPTKFTDARLTISLTPR